MKQEVINQIVQDCETIEKSGHGVVTVKIKNGAVYLIEATQSKLIERPLDTCHKKE